MNLRKLGLILVLAGTASLSAQATPFDYIYSTTFSLQSGTDTAGLDGATLTLKTSYDTSETYYDAYFGIYVGALSTSSSFTISGSSIPANNMTFDLSSAAYFPQFAGIWNSDSNYLTVNLPSSQTLTLQSNINSATGFDVAVGAPVQISDFGSTDSGSIFSTSDANYIPGSTPTITTEAEAVPEPSSFQYLLCTFLALAASIGWKRFSARAA